MSVDLPDYIRTEWKGEGSCELQFCDVRPTPSKNKGDEGNGKKFKVECYISIFNVWEYDDKKKSDCAVLECEDTYPKIPVPFEVLKWWDEHWKLWWRAYVPLAWSLRYPQFQDVGIQKWYQAFLQECPELESYLKYCLDIPLKRDDEIEKLGLSYNIDEESLKDSSNWSNPERFNLINSLYEEFYSIRYWAHFRLFLRDLIFEVNEELFEFFCSKGICDVPPSISSLKAEYPSLCHCTTVFPWTLFNEAVSSDDRKLCEHIDMSSPKMLLQIYSPAVDCLINGSEDDSFKQHEENIETPCLAEEMKVDCDISSGELQLADKSNSSTNEANANPLPEVIECDQITHFSSLSVGEVISDTMQQSLNEYELPISSRMMEGQDAKMQGQDKDLLKELKKKKEIKVLSGVGWALKHLKENVVDLKDEQICSITGDLQISHYKYPEPQVTPKNTEADSQENQIYQPSGIATAVIKSLDKGARIGVDATWANYEILWTFVKMANQILKFFPGYTYARDVLYSSFRICLAFIRLILGLLQRKIFFLRDKPHSTLDPQKRLEYCSMEAKALQQFRRKLGFVFKILPKVPLLQDECVFLSKFNFRASSKGSRAVKDELVRVTFQEGEPGGTGGVDVTWLTEEDLCEILKQRGVEPNEKNGASFEDPEFQAVGLQFRDMILEMTKSCQMRRLKRSHIDEEIPSDIPKTVHSYWFQRHRLFLRYSDGIIMDEESWYSVTPEMIASHQAERCACDVVIDAFCGAGGNAIQLAFTCNQVIAIDIDPRKLELARNNAKVYGVLDRITFILGDFFNLASSLLADVVLLTPPWGGMTYNRTDAYDIFRLDGKIDGRQLFEVAKRITPNIALYLPKSSNIFQVINLVGSQGRVDLEYSHISNKRKGLTAYFGDLVDFGPLPDDS